MHVVVSALRRMYSRPTTSERGLSLTEKYPESGKNRLVAGSGISLSLVLCQPRLWLGSRPGHILSWEIKLIIRIIID